MILVIALFICIILMIICQLMLIRNHKVYRFQLIILYSESEYIKSINYKTISHKIYDSLPPYNKMLFSFKSLNHCKPWIAKEDYEKIKPFINEIEQRVDERIEKERYEE